jgi:pyridoxine kinase
MTILSIQSHVAYGHVGNSAAVFPLQRLGFEVWPLHTVQFSNHAGYDGLSGEVFPARHVRDVIEGMAALGALSSCDAVLSGYLGEAAVGAAVLDALARVRAGNPAALYACDPVMGDGGKGLYVPDDIPAFLRERALPAADIVTPNVFELEQLTGGRIASLDDAIAAGRTVLGLGPSIVVVTSLRHADTAPNRIEILAVTAKGTWRVTTAFLEFETPPNGAGDLTAALFLGHYLRTRDVKAALEGAAAGVFAVIAATHEAGTRELQLIAAQDEIVAPKRRFSAEQIV